VQKSRSPLEKEEQEKPKKAIPKNLASQRSTMVKADRKRLTVWAVCLIIIASLAAYNLQPESLKYFLEFLYLIVTSLVL